MSLALNNGLDFGYLYFYTPIPQWKVENGY